MSLGGGIEPTLHLPVPEIQLLGVTQEEWDGEEELQDGEGEGDEEEEEEGEEGRNKVRLVRSHAIRDSVSPPPPERREEIAANMRGETSDQRSVVSSDGGEVGALEGGVVSGEIFGANQPTNREHFMYFSGTDSGRGDTDTPEGMPALKYD